MSPWLERLGIPSLVSAVVSAIVGGAIGYLTANTVDRESKARSAKLDQIVRFTSSNDTILSEVNNYIGAIATGKDIPQVQIKLRTELNKQIVESTNLLTYFPGPKFKQDIGLYQSNVVEFAGEIKNSTDPTKMSRWVEKFDKVAVSRRALTNELVKAVDIKL
jgi:hypothetical protein